MNLVEPLLSIERANTKTSSPPVNLIIFSEEVKELRST